MAFLMFCYSGGVGSTWVLAGDCLRLAFFPSSVHTGAHNAGNKITLDHKASDPTGVHGYSKQEFTSYPYWGRSPVQGKPQAATTTALAWKSVCVRARGAYHGRREGGSSGQAKSRGGWYPLPMASRGVHGGRRW
ncbi:hypothetical protein CPAR01_08381 [Colletotrichum paranaense]|uniref:Secreted protein n=1 Tax=Colletotrichum paranaense TaxID=1914294 RepID=A0ABQ9SK36_9PEZI|nr:uncharacterized protein CPAR01_08381 [Colletotrichum paranaense]KAK1538268.1 hypothetical protein CPAR01_08381 [Colletotrichum paranaense]